MADTAPASTRAWLDRTLEEAGRRLTLVVDAGATNPTVCWTDDDGLTVTAKLHGDGVTLDAKGDDGFNPIGPLTFPRGWTEAP